MHFSRDVNKIHGNLWGSTYNEIKILDIEVFQESHLDRNGH